MHFTYCPVQIYKIMFRRFLSLRIWSSAQDYAVLGLLLNLVGFWISTWQNLSGGNDLYWRCTSFEKAFRRGRPLNILHDSFYMIHRGGRTQEIKIRMSPANWLTNSRIQSSAAIWQCVASFDRVLQCVAAHELAYPISSSSLAGRGGMFAGIVAGNGWFFWYIYLLCVRTLLSPCSMIIIPVCYDMTHSCVLHDSFICAPCFLHMCDTTHSHVWHDSFICVLWLNHMCAMILSHVWHASFICVTCLIHVRDMPH